MAETDLGGEAAFLVYYVVYVRVDEVVDAVTVLVDRVVLLDLVLGRIDIDELVEAILLVFLLVFLLRVVGAGLVLVLDPEIEKLGVVEAITLRRCGRYVVVGAVLPLDAALELVAGLGLGALSLSVGGNPNA